MLRPGSLIAKLLALAILALVLTAGFNVILQPLLRTYQDNQDKIARSTELLQRYRALAAEKPGLAERLSVVRSQDDPGVGYLSGPSDALAAAQLQDLVGETIERTGGEIMSTQILPATVNEDGPRLRRTALKLRFSATIDSLAATLYDLETIEPHLFIEELLVTSQQVRMRQNETDSGPRLDVRLDIVGYLRQSE